MGQGVEWLKRNLPWSAEDSCARGADPADHQPGGEDGCFKWGAIESGCLGGFRLGFRRGAGENRRKLAGSTDVWDAFERVFIFDFILYPADYSWLIFISTGKLTGDLCG
jgi:hypothetical protein